jgi:hypothetical protein
MNRRGIFSAEYSILRNNRIAARLQILYIYPSKIKSLRNFIILRGKYVFSGESWQSGLSAAIPLGRMRRSLNIFGELAEWLNAAVLKTVKDASPSGVRIPDSPQK